MSDTAPDIDPSLLQEFLAEGLESLDGVDPLFVQLEASPDDTAIVDGIFRPVHSVKGNSGFFGLSNIKSFAHVMENILGEIRSRKRKTTPNIIDLLLKGVDFLRGMLNRLATGDFSKEFTPEEQAHLDRLNQASAAGSADAEESKPDTPDVADLALSVKAAYDEFKAAIDDHGMSLLEDAINQLLAKVCPPPVQPIPADSSGPASWSLDGVDVTDTITELRTFVANIARDEKEEARCEKFIAAIDGLAALAREKGNHEALQSALAVLRDEFITLHQSGIGFDPLMASLMAERLEAVEHHIDRLTVGAAPRAGAGAGGAADERLAVGDVDVTESVDAIRTFLKDVANHHKDPEHLRRFQAAHEAIAALAAKAGREKLENALRDLVSDFTTLHESEVGFDPLMTELMLERLDEVVKQLDRIATEQPETPPGSAATPSAEQPARSPAADTVVMSPPAGGNGAPTPPAAAGAKAESSGKMIRVAEEKVDLFMSFVGELIITGEVFAYIQKKLEAFPEARQVSQEFKNANISFGELSSNLQKSLMEVRRVPLKSVLQKLPRIIRDTASQLNKHIDFEIHGEDVQIDKSLLEGLESPLVHMVRNSADHGIEMPADRKAAGKDEKGHVVISASATEERFTLTIKDDGKGLDVDAIKAKAVSRGLMSEDAARAMPDKEAFRLVFNAGLSTAKVVTDVSGRGVGMDVVLSNITKMGGQIGVDSVKGEGSVFTITLPMTVTLAVIDGLVAQIGSEQFIVPLVDVLESIRPQQDQVHSISGKGEVVSVRGELIPLVRLNDILGIQSDSITDPCEATVVLVRGKRGVPGAFMFDDVIGQQSVVVKDLGKQFADLASIQGGSILGNGRVGLVLDTNGILEMIGMQQKGD